MFTKIIVQLVALFIDPVPTEGLPDACEVVHRLTGHPTICALHPVGAPVYDGAVCCAGGSCFATATGECRTGETAYHCELGQEDATGEVHCFHEVPGYCDVHTCPPGDGGGWADGVCCSNGWCENFQEDQDVCSGDLYWCDDGVTNTDGSVSCFDPE